MAFARTVYTSNGATLSYSTGFTYNLPTDVQVLVNGALQTLTTNYTIPSVGTVTFVTAPANGARIVIRRSTSQATRQVDYQNATLLTEETLDLDSLQAFQMAQEALDASAEKSPYLDEVDYAFNANSHKIKNLTDPVAAQDAATKQWTLNQLAVGTPGTASGTTFAPSSTVISTNVQAAIQEVSDARIRKNYIINGGGRIAQRPNGGIPGLTNLFSACDRFFYAASPAASAGSGIQSTAMGGTVSQSSMQVAGYSNANSGALLFMGTYLESKDVAELTGGIGSLQAAVRHDCAAAINYTLGLYRLNSLDSASTGTTLIASASLSIAPNTPTVIKLENAALGVTTNGLYISLTVTTGVQTAKTFSFSDWQFERGAKCTSVEMPLFAADLAVCKRYYEPSATGDTLIRSMNVVSANVYYFCDAFTVEKRVIPTITTVTESVSAFPVVAATIAIISTKGLSYNRTANATSVAGYQSTRWIAEAEIT